VVAPTMDDAPSAKFTWTIDNFSELPNRIFSDAFSVGGFNWYICFYPIHQCLMLITCVYECQVIFIMNVVLTDISLNEQAGTYLFEGERC